MGSLFPLALMFNAFWTATGSWHFGYLLTLRAGCELPGRLLFEFPHVPEGWSTQLFFALST